MVKKSRRSNGRNNDAMPFPKKKKFEKLEWTGLLNGNERKPFRVVVTERRYPMAYLYEVRKDGKKELVLFDRSLDKVQRNREEDVRKEIGDWLNDLGIVLP